MAEKVRRRLFRRVVLWDPASGTIIDLPTRYVLSADGPTESEEYARTTSGSKRPISRSHSVQVPVTHREGAHIGRTLQRFGCPMKAVFLGPSQADVWAWLEPSKIQVRDPNTEAGQQPGRVLDLESDIFYPAIWEGMGLLSGVPWRGTTQQVRNGNNVLRTEGNVRAGYEGPLWSVPAGASVNLSGNASGIDSANPATLEFQFPAWGSVIRLDDETETLSGSLEALDWNGNSLAGPSQELTIPVGTWTVKATVEDSPEVPDVYVVRCGESFGVVEGGASPDCSPVSNPNWDYCDDTDAESGDLTTESGLQILAEDCDPITTTDSSTETAFVTATLTPFANESTTTSSILTESNTAITTEGGTDITNE